MKEEFQIGRKASDANPSPESPERPRIERLKVGLQQQRGAGGCSSMEGGQQRHAKGRGAPSDRELKDAFDFFDIDNNGRISCAELQKVLKFLGTKVSEDEVKTMIADVDTNRNGTVEFNEFLRMMRAYHHRHCGGHSEDAEMWEAFKAFDHNGDNFIDFSELKKTMQFLGEEVTDADVKSMIKEADVDNDGRINFEEFKKMLNLLHQRATQH